MGRGGSCPKPVGRLLRTDVRWTLHSSGSRAAFAVPQPPEEFGTASWQRTNVPVPLHPVVSVLLLSVHVPSTTPFRRAVLPEVPVEVPVKPFWYEVSDNVLPAGDADVTV